ncbi:uncharacterized protein J3R85_019400 [Psidium guajava]|nr:uncharacterized protein J3R85_019400 [Psidium guajava]
MASFVQTCLAITIAFTMGLIIARTIRENIVYGTSHEMSEMEVVEAARAVNAHNFIVALKEGYHTWCGDKGVQLSGGQKQRVAVARAILRNPTMLLLNEATSSLDSQSEKVVQNALEHLMVRRTTLMVAHGLSTVQGCDVIAVQDKGKVVEKGSHSSLLAKGPNRVMIAIHPTTRVFHNLHSLY